MDTIQRRMLGLKSNKNDEEIVEEILKMLSKRELTIDRASRVLEDARKMLPILGKLVT